MHQSRQQDQEARREDRGLPGQERLQPRPRRQAHRAHGRRELLQRRVPERLLEEVRIPRRLEEVHLYPLSRLREVHRVAVHQAQGEGTPHPEALLRPLLPRARSRRCRSLGDRYLQGRSRRDPGIHPPEVLVRGEEVLPRGGHSQARDRLRTGLLLGPSRHRVQHRPEGRREMGGQSSVRREAPASVRRCRDRRNHRR